MPRLLFKKTENAIWISHLDLMRLFQRAFKRAGLQLQHTQGFNPRPSVSIALPLSVGISSECELLEFDLDGQTVSCDEIRDRLNAVLVKGIEVTEVYEGGRKYRDLSLLSCDIAFVYDDEVPETAVGKITELFSKETILLPKKTKSGMQEQDIIPMIRRAVFSQTDAHTVAANVLICCQNPTLNPAQILLAIQTFLPEFAPSHWHCRRIEMFDSNKNVFR